VNLPQYWIAKMSLFAGLPLAYLQNCPKPGRSSRNAVMLLFGFSFPKTSTPTSTLAHSDAALQRLGTDTPVAPDTLAPAPCTERHHHDKEVDSLGHYIDSRLWGERFRVD
jgi:hypothetical protein